VQKTYKESKENSSISSIWLDSEVQSQHALDEYEAVNALLDQRGYDVGNFNFNQDWD
jgi:hypothetical protein